MLVRCESYVLPVVLRRQCRWPRTRELHVDHPCQPHAVLVEQRIAVAAHVEQQLLHAGVLKERLRAARARRERRCR